MKKENKNYLQLLVDVARKLSDKAEELIKTRGSDEMVNFLSTIIGYIADEADSISKQEEK